MSYMLLISSSSLFGKRVFFIRFNFESAILFSRLDSFFLILLLYLLGFFYFYAGS
uniref:Uncharacterized protein n=1 Tax=Arundo donax TaxID=35708 RepID=A0A0A9EWQ9_ARUDO